METKKSVEYEDNSRKKFIRQAGAGLFLAGLPGINAIAGNGSPSVINSDDFFGDGAADNEGYWKKIARKYYAVADDYINLENGYYGIQPKPVLQEFYSNLNKANYHSSRFARKEFPALSASIKKELAVFLGVSDEEIIITRNATEALNIAIQGYPFKPGDEVVINQLDYFSMIDTFRMLEKRGKIKVNAFEMPLLPAHEDEIIDIYRKQITPKTRLLLLTHVSNITGLIIPVAKITAMARERGVDTITDSAHALGHIPFSLPGLGSDFVGLNLHKWIGNPIGAGVLYIKKERIREMSPLFGDITNPDENINKLSHFGTTPFAVIMTIPASIAFHKLMDVEKASARLHYLKTSWVNELKGHEKIELLVPAEMSCAIASFRIKGQESRKVADRLFNDHKILTINRTLGTLGCVRVTPALYNSLDDIKKFVGAMNVVAGIGQ